MGGKPDPSAVRLIAFGGLTGGRPDPSTSRVAGCVGLVGVPVDGGIVVTARGTWDWTGGIPEPSAIRGAAQTANPNASVIVDQWVLFITFLLWKSRRLLAVYKPGFSPTRIACGGRTCVEISLFHCSSF